AKIARVEADMKAGATALEQYQLDHTSYVEDHDYPSDRSQRGLLRLTSPVSYIASLPMDPFPGKIMGAVEDKRTFEFGSGSANSPGKQWPVQAYIIFSAGPNQREEVDGNDGFPFGTTIRSYDPSN